ncbi:hypothetical protein [Halocatena halophila]|uniref:hypothetical protein n=1 Tax=Halocatena halophila TaxID=2814576 RepID=UPI002ED35EF7
MAEKSTNEELASRLPIWMPKDPDSGNYQLFTPLADTIDDLKSDLDDVNAATMPQTANSVEEIERLAIMVDVLPKKDESLEHYRARVISNYQLVTSEGTISDLLGGLATMLNVRENNFGYSEPHNSTSGYGSVVVTIPLPALDQTALSGSEVASMADKLVPISYNVDILTRGTFTYINPTDYNNSNFEANKAYDGLDSNGDPKNNGGTYAGLLE